MKKWFDNQSRGYFFRGLLMGAADVVPGVSGGTIAFITGIYYQLIQSIAQVSFAHGLAALQVFFFVANPSKRKIAIQKLAELNWRLFVPLGLGILFAILSLSRAIPFLLREHPQPTYGLFFGLVLASMQQPLRQVTWNWGLGLLFLISTLLFFSLFHFGGVLPGSTHPAFILMSGAVAVCALILPGISGSYILLMLGQYQIILEALHSRNLILIGCFIFGMALGLFSFIRALKWLLTNYFSATLVSLCGIMLGSLRVLWPYQYGSTPTLVSEWAMPVGFVVIGMAIVLLLERLSKQEPKIN